jgi:hypothetical protein
MLLRNVGFSHHYKPEGHILHKNDRLQIEVSFMKRKPLQNATGYDDFNALNKQGDTNAHHSVIRAEVSALTLTRRSCLLPLYHVMTAGGLEPADSQETSYRRSATRGSSLDNIRTVKGRTASKNKSDINTDTSE